MSFGDYGALISIITLIITWCIVQPLKQSLTSLQASIDKLVSRIDKTDDYVNELRERIATVEASVKALHKRLDDLKRGVKYD